MTMFPADFLWGSGTAAHQVEGGNTGNDWWDWEHDPASPAVESSGDGIDHYHRYDSDFALLASLGQNAHRMSIEWSRVEPAPGEFSTAALDHYARVLESQARHGLTAFLTLYHFTVPRWFAARGCWLADDAVELFGRFAGVVAERLGDLVPYFCTVNEPQAIALMSYLVGEFPPGHQDLGEAVAVNATLIQAHRVATEAVRAGRGTPRVGTCLQLMPAEAVDPSDDESVAAADFLRDLMIDSHLADLRAGGDVGDFVGLQYYTRLRLAGGLPVPPPADAETTLMGWEVYPDGFAEQLHAASSSGLPVIVTENGIATADDEQRVRYLQSHLGALATARDEGVDVRGYLHWSSFDNFEWAHGYRPTFGLVGIDRSDGLRRVVRPSAEAFGRVAATGDLAALLA
jgi:beta-glucosidase